jgi:hypothetical protein
MLACFSDLLYCRLLLMLRWQGTHTMNHQHLLKRSQHRRRYELHAITGGSSSMLAQQAA